MPYAQHSVTSYKNGQMVDKAAMSNSQNYIRSGTQTKTFLLPKGGSLNAPHGMNVKLNPAGIPHSQNKTLASVGLVTNMKATTNGKSGKVPKKLSVGGGDGGPQYIDPPEEFQFVSNKKSR